MFFLSNYFSYTGRENCIVRKAIRLSFDTDGFSLESGRPATLARFHESGRRFKKSTEQYHWLKIRSNYKTLIAPMIREMATWMLMFSCSENSECFPGYSTRERYLFVSFTSKSPSHLSYIYFFPYFGHI